jgi:hypothetical protein
MLGRIDLFPSNLKLSGYKVRSRSSVALSFGRLCAYYPRANLLLHAHFMPPALVYLPAYVVMPLG